MPSHRIVNPSSLAPPRGYSHAIVAEGRRTVYLAGQAGHDADGRLVGESLVLQFERAAANVVEALASAGAAPIDLVSMQIFVTDAEAYRQAARQIGKAYRSHFGDHYPAISVFEVSQLFDAAAKVELVCVAVTG
jgi:enamine deaminase RidA (YjgF/YER057c/UK114 family)